MNNVFERPKTPITIEDLAELEANYHIALPENYKQLLLLYNGGVPERCVYVGKDSTCIIHNFYSVKFGEVLLEHTLNALQVWEQVIPDSLLPIAYDPGGNNYCISMAQEDYGKIYAWYHDVGGEQSFVANSLEEFLKDTITYEEWQERCQRVNIDALAAAVKELGFYVFKLNEGLQQYTVAIELAETEYYLPGMKSFKQIFLISNENDKLKIAYDMGETPLERYFDDIDNAVLYVKENLLPYYK